MKAIEIDRHQLARAAGDHGGATLLGLVDPRAETLDEARDEAWQARPEARRAAVPRGSGADQRLLHQAVEASTPASRVHAQKGLCTRGPPQNSPNIR